MKKEGGREQFINHKHRYKIQRPEWRAGWNDYHLAHNYSRTWKALKLPHAAQFRQSLLKLTLEWYSIRKMHKEFSR